MTHSNKVIFTHASLLVGLLMSCGKHPQQNTKATLQDCRIGANYDGKTHNSQLLQEAVSGV